MEQFLSDLTEHHLRDWSYFETKIQWGYTGKSNQTLVLSQSFCEQKDIPQSIQNLKLKRSAVSFSQEQTFHFVSKKDLATQILIYFLSTEQKVLDGYLFENNESYYFSSRLNQHN